MVGILRYTLHFNNPAGVENPQGQVFVLGMEPNRDQIIPTGLDSEQKTIRSQSIAKTDIRGVGNGSVIHNGSPVIRFC
jgi:hypothetical protein